MIDALLANTPTSSTSTAMTVDTGAARSCSFKEQLFNKTKAVLAPQHLLGPIDVMATDVLVVEVIT